MDNQKILEELKNELQIADIGQEEVICIMVKKYLEKKDDLIREMLEESRQIVEPYVQMEGFKPETAPEAYQQNVLEEIYDEWKDWKQKWLDKINHK